MMSGWQERVDARTDPQVLLEHVARYRFARPLSTSAGAWIDLGCGNGFAAELALDGREPAAHVLLVDRETSALETAGGRFPHAERMRADLGSEEDLGEIDARVRALHEAGDGDGACITCFELIEHLDRFAPLLGLLTRLAAETPTTVVLSVPNDAFWSLHNPYHQTLWGDDAFEEFRRLLPADTLVAHQVALHGTLVEPQGGGGDAVEQLPLTLRREAVPTHYVVAFGGAEEALGRVALAEQLDLQERRAWERQRESDLAWMRQHELDRDYEVAQLRLELDALRAAADPRAETEGAAS